MSDNSEIPSKDEIIRNMAKHLQTHMEDGEEVLLRTYDLAFIFFNTFNLSIKI